MSTEHVRPLKPGAQRHLKSLIKSMHVAPLLQGSQRHSLTSVSQ